MVPYLYLPIFDTNTSYIFDFFFLEKHKVDKKLFQYQIKRNLPVEMEIH